MPILGEPRTPLPVTTNGGRRDRSNTPAVSASVDASPKTESASRKRKATTAQPTGEPQQKRATVANTEAKASAATNGVSMRGKQRRRSQKQQGPRGMVTRSQRKQAATTPKKTGEKVRKAATDDESEEDSAIPEGEYEVEEILDSAVDADTLERMYFVKWKGYDESESTWEPRENLIAHCSQLLDEFEKAKKLRSAMAASTVTPMAKATRKTHTSSTPTTPIGTGRRRRRPRRVKT